MPDVKILVISNLFPPNVVGGYELSCSDTVELLRQAGHEILVVTSDPLDEIESSLSSDQGILIKGTLVLHWNWNRGFKIFDEKRAGRNNVRELASVIDDFNPDVIYAWNLFGLGREVERYLSSEWKDKMIFHMMDLSYLAYRSWMSRALSRAGIEFDYRRAGTAIYCSNFLKEKLSKTRVEHAHVIYPFLRNLEILKHKRNFILSDQIRLVYVGQFTQNKGVDKLIAAVSSARKQTGYDIKLDLYIPGYSNEIEIPEEVMSDRFTNCIVGEVRDKIASELIKYDIGVFPSVWEEPFGIAQIELMAAGLPVVSSMRGGSCEVYDGSNLVPFDPDDPDSLTRTIIYLIENYEEVAKSIATSARESIFEQFDAEQYIEQVLDVCIEVVSRSIK